LKRGADFWSGEGKGRSRGQKRDEMTMRGNKGEILKKPACLKQRKESARLNDYGKKTQSIFHWESYVLTAWDEINCGRKSKMDFSGNDCVKLLHCPTRNLRGGKRWRISQGDGRQSVSSPTGGFGVEGGRGSAFKKWGGNRK